MTPEVTSSWSGMADSVIITTSITKSNFALAELKITYISDDLTDSGLEIAFPRITAKDDESLVQGLQNVIKNPNNLPLHFQSNDLDIVSVEDGDNGDQLVLGEKEGTATITATFTPSASYPYASWEGTFEVIHRDSRNDTDIRFNTDAVNATIGKDDFIAPVLILPEGIEPEEIIWFSSASAVAYTEDGINYSLGNIPGEAVITATFPGNSTYKPAEASFTLTLRAPIGIKYAYHLLKDLSMLEDGTPIIFTCRQKGVVAGELNTSGSNKYLSSLDCEGLDASTEIIEDVSDAQIFYAHPINDNQFSFTTLDSNGDTKYLNGSTGNAVIYSDTPEAATLTVLDNGNTNVNFGSSEGNLRFNPSNPRFATYTSGQTEIQIFAYAIIVGQAGISFSAENVDVTDNTAETFNPLDYFDNPNEIDLTEITFSSENHHIVGIDPYTGLPFFEGDTYGITTLTATFPGNDTFQAATTSMTVNYHDPRIVPEFYFETDNIDADLDDIYEMPKLVYPDFIDPSEITWTCSNDNLLTIEDEYIMTGSVYGKASITASYEGNDTYAAVSAYFTVTVGQVSSSEIYNLVTSLDQLQDGSKVIIACREKSKVATTLNSGSYLNEAKQDNLDATTESFDKNTSPASVFTLVQKSENEFAFQFPDGKYLDSTTKNKVTSSSSPKYVIISFSNDNAVLNFGTYGTLQYNPGATRFSAYTSTQTSIQLFVLEAGTGKDPIEIVGSTVKTFDEVSEEYVVSEEATLCTPTNSAILVHLQGLPDGYAIDNAQVTFVDVTNEANIHYPDVPLAFHDDGYFEIDYPYGMPGGHYEMNITLPETDFYLAYEEDIHIPIDVYLDRATREAMFMIDGALELKGHHTHLFTTHDDHHLFSLPEAPADGITVHYMVTPALSTSGALNVRRVAASPVGHSVYDHENGIMIPRTTSDGTISFVAEQNDVQAPAVTLTYSGLPMSEGVYLVGDFSDFEVNSNAILLTLDDNGVYTGYFKPATTPTAPIEVGFVQILSQNDRIVLGPRAQKDDDVYSTQSDITISDIPAGSYWEGYCGYNDAHWFLDPGVFTQLGEVGLKVAINTNAGVVGFGGEFQTSVDAIDSDTIEDSVYFTLQGVRVEHPVNGIYIRVSKGKATKVSL